MFNGLYNDQVNEKDVSILAMTVIGGAVGLVAVFVGIIGGTSVILDRLFPPTKVAQPNNSLAVTTETVKVVEEENAVVSAVRKATPAVVTIVSSTEIPVYENCIPGMEDPEYGCERGVEERRTTASGFVVSSNGYVMTNNHVVSAPDGEYMVILNDGRRVEGSVIERDAGKDIALIKIEANNLPFLTFSDSSNLQVGQTAIAIGTALGKFDKSVSKGVVSGLSRNITATGGRRSSVRLEGLIQTDAAINPGNSGGPLLDLEGKVIGMNVAMATGQNIAFAIPGNEVKELYEKNSN